jgi:hypothetical protein
VIETPKVRPIIFSGPMIQAILNGWKTQTRRVLKPQPPADRDKCWVEYPHGQPMACYRSFPDGGSARTGLCECPYGGPGDRLWVRESFWTDRREPGVVIYDATPEWGKYRDMANPIRSTFPDDTEPSREEARRAMLPKFWSKKPARFMPRWASRLTLEVQEVRVERVQEIDELGALDEGVQDDGSVVGTMKESGKPPRTQEWSEGEARDGFARAWDGINRERGFGWDLNPWVWVVTFRRTSGPTEP